MDHDGPSEHLSWYELACHDEERTPYPLEWRNTRASRVSNLAYVFEALREYCGGRPLRVLSAYRTPKHNRSIPGAKRSQHVQGLALDLGTPRGWSHKGFRMKVVAFVNEEVVGVRVTGLGLYPTFVHIDLRRSGRLARWNGYRTEADT